MTDDSDELELVAVPRNKGENESALNLKHFLKKEFAQLVACEESTRRVEQREFILDLLKMERSDIKFCAGAYRSGLSGWLCVNRISCFPPDELMRKSLQLVSL